MLKLKHRYVRVVLLAALLGGCGEADQTRTARETEPAEPGLVDFEPAVNVCPHFEGSLILPRMVPEGEPAFIVVRATDPDSDDLNLKYLWSALSGEFSEPREPVTEYRCAEAGEQVLTVVASDLRDCDVELQLDITCVSK